MRGFFALALAIVAGEAAAPAARAGAWLREPGEGMIYLSQETSRDRDWGGTWGYTTLYGEYGVRPWLTLGIDSGKGEQDDDWKAVTFARIGWDPAFLPGRVAVELGLGVSGTEDGGVEGLVQPVLSWGNSFETALGWGWVNVGAKGEFFMGPTWKNVDTNPEYVPWQVTEGYKLDVTLGLNPTPRTQVIVEFRGENPTEGEQMLRFVPSVARRFGEHVWVHLGGIVGVENDNSVGLLLGSRFEF
jgi:hypothetical protein